MASTSPKNQCVQWFYLVFLSENPGHRYVSTPDGVHERGDSAGVGGVWHIATSGRSANMPIKCMFTICKHIRFQPYIVACLTVLRADFHTFYPPLQQDPDNLLTAVHC